MIFRRGATITLAFAIGSLVAPVAADAQQAAKIPRIGYLSAFSRSDPPRWRQGFWQGLRDLGYTEGVNIAIEHRDAEGQAERLPDLAAELVRLNVDVIVAESTPASLAAKQATTRIPIVVTIVADPVGSGLVASLARPAGNITGLSLQHPDLAAKRLQLLKETVPRVSRVGVLWNSASPVTAPQVREAEAAARALGVQFESLEVRTSDDFEGGFRAAIRKRVGALLVVQDFLVATYQGRTAALAAKRRLPSISGEPGFAEAGGLMTYGANYQEVCRRAATYVDKILKGAKPADLPVEQPTRFELVVNMKTAKSLGLTIPPSILVRADQVIQ